MSPSGVLLFGGSFNPIHIGHLIVARSAAEQLGITRIILIPSAQPPHKHAHKLAPAGHRLEMAGLAVEEDPLFEVSDVELQRSGPSYTMLTIEAFREELGPDVELHWLIGADSLPELWSWYRVDELVDACRIVIAVRPGYEEPDLTPLTAKLSAVQIERLREAVLPTPLIDISATNIRSRVAESLPIRHLVPESVRRYIEQQQLYRAT